MNTFAPSADPTVQPLAHGVEERVKRPPNAWPGVGLPKTVSEVDAWIDASIVRTRSQGLASGYVRVGDLRTPYHLSMSNAGPLVCSVSWRAHEGALAPVHDPFSVQAHECALVLQAWVAQRSEDCQNQLKEEPRRAILGITDPSMAPAPSPMASQVARRTRRGA